MANNLSSQSPAWMAASAGGTPGSRSTARARAAGRRRGAHVGPLDQPGGDEAQHQVAHHLHECGETGGPTGFGERRMQGAPPLSAPSRSSTA